MEMNSTVVFCLFRMPPAALTLTGSTRTGSRFSCRRIMPAGREEEWKKAFQVHLDADESVGAEVGRCTAV